MEENTAKHKMTASEWDMARAMYIAGSSVEDILPCFPNVRIKKSQMYEKFSKEGLTEKKYAMQERVNDDMVTLAENKKLEVNQKCIKLFNSGANIIDKLLGKYGKELKGAELSKGQARATAYNIDLLMSGVTKIQKGLRVAYGMDADGKLFEKEPEVLVIEGIDTGKI